MAVLIDPNPELLGDPLGRLVQCENGVNPSTPRPEGLGLLRVDPFDRIIIGRGEGFTTLPPPTTPNVSGM